MPCDKLILLLFVLLSILLCLDVSRAAILDPQCTVSFLFVLLYFFCFCIYFFTRRTARCPSLFSRALLSHTLQKRKKHIKRSLFLLLLLCTRFFCQVCFCPLRFLCLFLDFFVFVYILDKRNDHLTPPSPLEPASSLRRKRRDSVTLRSRHTMPVIPTDRPEKTRSAQDRAFPEGCPEGMPKRTGLPACYFLCVRSCC